MSGGAATTTTGSSVASWGGIGISLAEKWFLQDGVAQDFRTDGRSCLDYRPITVSTNAIPSASGSARVRTADSDLMVAVKLDMSTPTAEAPDEGSILVHIDCSASVSPLYARHGGSDFSFFLASLISKLCLNRTVIPRKSLCVAPGSYCWVVYVDVMVLNSGGNLLDAISLGIKAALTDTMIPKIHVYEDDNDEGDNTKQQQKLTFDVDGRPEYASPFPAENVPICITVGQVCSRLVWDLSSEEESCADSTVTAAVDSAGVCWGIHKSGTSTLELSSIPVIVQSSRRVAMELHSKLNEVIAELRRKAIDQQLEKCSYDEPR